MQVPEPATQRCDICFEDVASPFMHSFGEDCQGLERLAVAIKKPAISLCCCCRGCSYGLRCL
jgi:hypothetical protein